MSLFYFAANLCGGWLRERWWIQLSAHASVLMSHPMSCIFWKTLPYTWGRWEWTSPITSECFSENRFDLSDPRSLQGLPWGSPSHVLGTASPGASSQKGASLWVYHVATLHEGLSALAQSGWWWAKRRILFKAFVLWTVPMNFPQSITEASSNKIDGDRPIRQSGQVLAHRLAKKIIQRMRQSAFCTFQNVIVQRDELHFVWATHSCFPLYSF